MANAIWPERVKQTKDMLKTSSVDDVAEHWGLSRSSFLCVCKKYNIPVEKKKPQRDRVTNEKVTGTDENLIKLRNELLKRAKL